MSALVRILVEDNAEVVGCVAWNTSGAEDSVEFILDGTPAFVVPSSGNPSPPIDVAFGDKKDLCFSCAFFPCCSDSTAATRNIHNMRKVDNGPAWLCIDANHNVPPSVIKIA